jgi:MFS family permease
MLAAFAASNQRARVFGFHRAMDHAGAVLGPLLASAFLFFYPNEYRTLFTLTLIPGAIVMLVLWRVPDTRHENTPSAVPRRIPGAGELPASYYKALIVIMLFTLGNASDAFLLLRLSDLGVAAFWIPLLWSALHVVKMVASLGGGELSDRFGRRRLIALGWIAYALVYAGFGWFDRPAIVIAVFLSYGVYFGLTEGVEKAWIADMAPESVRGTAFGIYNAALGLGSLAASLLFGFVWTRISPEAAFFTGAGLALLATILLATITAPSRHGTT